MSKSYLEIQQEVITKYKIVINTNSTCHSRMHAHTNGSRMICKWQPKNSLKTTFDLFHEIGHIMTTKRAMRRCESEYYATIWALEEAKKYEIEIPLKEIAKNQKYIDMELMRGISRNGSNYRENYNLLSYDKNEILERKVKEPKRKAFVL